MVCNVKINNPPLQAERFIVARLSRGKLWYWGSWDDEKEAKRVASEFENGIVMERKEG